MKKKKRATTRNPIPIKLPRKFLRGIAKYNMKRQGHTQICKKDGSGGQSFFAKNWRDWVNPNLK